MNRGAWWASQWGHKESDMPERLCEHMHPCACTHTHTALGPDSKQITFKGSSWLSRMGPYFPFRKHHPYSLVVICSTSQCVIKNVLVNENNLFFLNFKS